MLKEVMTPEVEVIRPNASPTEAAMTAMRMKDLDVGLIPVCDGDRLCGMLTDRDIAVRSDGVKLGIVGTPRRHRQCYLPRYRGPYDPSPDVSWGHLGSAAGEGGRDVAWLCPQNSRRPLPTWGADAHLARSKYSLVSYFHCTTGNVSHSVKDHTWSARPAAIAGVCGCHPPSVWCMRSVRTGQQKL